VSVAAPRAVDLATGVAGAYATKLLAEVGWDVVKVEPPGGDPLRRQGSRWGGGQGGAFAFANHGKRGVVLEDRARLEALVQAADVVVGDFSPAGAEASGIEREAFATLGPKAGVVSVTPFGLRGPRASWTASDLVVQAASGLMFLTGEWDQPPMQLPPYAAAMTGGLAAASAAIAAMLSANLGGDVRRVDVSMVEAMGALTYSPASAYAHTGEVARREQRVKQALRMVPASDRFVYCAPGAVGNVRMEGVAQLIDEPRLAEERFQTAEGRMQHWDEYLELFVPPFLRQTAQQWFEQAEALHLTFALVQTVDDLFSCPQVAARELLREVPRPEGVAGLVHAPGSASAGLVAIPGRPFHLEGGPPAPTRSAPAEPGQDTAEVLTEWLT